MNGPKFLRIVIVQKNSWGNRIKEAIVGNYFKIAVWTI